MRLVVNWRGWLVEIPQAGHKPSRGECDQAPNSQPPSEEASRILSLLLKPCTVLVRTTARDAEPCMHSTPPSAPDHQTPPRT